MSPGPVHVAAVQMVARPGAVAENLSRAEEFVRKAAVEDVDLILLPEFFDVGYSFELSGRQLGEPLDGPAGSLIRRLAGELGVWLGGCIYEAADRGCFDTFLLVAPDGRQFTHRKRVPSGFEGLFFEAGDDPFVVDTELGRIALVICAESEHGDHLREVVAATPDLVLLTYSDPSRSPIMERLVPGFNDRVRGLQSTWARATGVPVVSACITGTFSSKFPVGPFGMKGEFYGQTAVLDAAGTPIVELIQDEGVVTTRLDLGTPPRPTVVVTDRWVPPTIPRWARAGMHTIEWVSARGYRRWRRSGEPVWSKPLGPRPLR